MTCHTGVTPTYPSRLTGGICDCGVNGTGDCSSCYPRYKGKDCDDCTSEFYGEYCLWTSRGSYLSVPINLTLFSCSCILIAKTLYIIKCPNS